MNQQEYNRLRELGWRRRLTATEEADLQQYLAANPAEQADWRSDADLSSLLERLPEAPQVSSNFTARVLKAVELESAAAARGRVTTSFRQIFHSWLPRVAVASVVVAFLLAGYHHREMTARAALARNVASLAETVSSDPELMKDFESIRELGNHQTATDATADTELIALMK